MKHKVTEATQVTFQCVSILILSDNREEKYVFGLHHETRSPYVTTAADFIDNLSLILTATFQIIFCVIFHVIYILHLRAMSESRFLLLRPVEILVFGGFSMG